MVSLDRECTGKSGPCCLPGFSGISVALYAPLFRKSETAGKKRHKGQQISGQLQWILRFQRNDRLRAIHSPFRFRRPQLTSEDALLGRWPICRGNRGQPRNARLRIGKGNRGEEPELGEDHSASSSWHRQPGMVLAAGFVVLARNQRRLRARSLRVGMRLGPECTARPEQRRRDACRESALCGIPCPAL